LLTVAAPVVDGVYGPYTTGMTTTSSTTSSGSAVYVDQNMPYQYLIPPQQYPASIASNPHSETASPNGQSESASPGRLDVRIAGHARAVSLPASVVMQSTGSQSADHAQQNGQSEVEQRMYGLGLDAPE
jgi:hypothetical protein